MREQIIKAIGKASGIKKADLEIPSNPVFGDYSSNVALVLAKKEKQNPRELAGVLVEKLRKDKFLAKIVEKIDVAGPGFINFWLSKQVFLDILVDINKKKDLFGKSNLLAGKKLMFEYAHPNTHKAFHIGHLRNISTGEALARIADFTGAKVIRVNYQGDVGLHIAKAIWGIKNLGFSDPQNVIKRAEFLGKAYARGAALYEENENDKKEINEINQKIYSQDNPEINKLYTETRKWSLDYFDLIYKRLYTDFDRLYFESEIAERGKEIALLALKKGVLQESQGAVIFPGKKFGLHDRVFISGAGVPTYEAKDLGLAELQFKEFSPDLILHVVGPEQAGYFQVIFKALELIEPQTKDKEFHIVYGWVKLKEGKMSSRSGNVVLGEFLLDEAKRKLIEAFKTPEKVAEEIAVGAVKYTFLKTGLSQEIAFDVKESISLEGNSGPYLQYTFARTQSVLAKAGKQINKSTNQPINSEEANVLRTLIHFPEVVESAATNYAPNLICNYLFDLAQKFNTFYNKHRILGSSDLELRLKLTSATGQVLKTGLKLLGIESPEKM